MALKISGLVFVPVVPKNGTLNSLMVELSKKESSTIIALGEIEGVSIEAMSTQLFSEMIGDCQCQCSLSRIGNYYNAKAIVKICGIDTVQRVRSICPAYATIGALVKAYNAGMNRIGLHNKE